MLGDTAVAINPEDERYLDLHGKTVQLPLMDREIPIILDDMADPKFGTGVVKVTPGARSQRLRSRHAATTCRMIQVIDEDAQDDRRRRARTPDSIASKPASAWSPISKSSGCS